MSAKPTPQELLSAIHKHCMDCSGGSRTAVQECGIKECALHQFRQGNTREGEKTPKGQISFTDLMEGKRHDDTCNAGLDGAYRLRGLPVRQ